MNIDDQAASAVMAYVQAGKRGEDLLGAMKCAVEAAILAEREECAKVCRDLADGCRNVNGWSSAEMMQAYEYAEADILKRSNYK